MKRYQASASHGKRICHIISEWGRKKPQRKPKKLTLKDTRSRLISQNLTTWSINLESYFLEALTHNVDKGVSLGLKPDQALVVLEAFDDYLEEAGFFSSAALSKKTPNITAYQSAYKKLLASHLASLSADGLEIQIWLLASAFELFHLSSIKS